jgi:hypothetical protein
MAPGPTASGTTAAGSAEVETTQGPETGPGEDLLDERGSSRAPEFGFER